MRSFDAEGWKQGMQEEIESILSNGTFVEVEITMMPLGTYLLTSCFVWQRRINVEGRVARYKVRLCACGFQ